ncbi:TerC family protein [Brevibacillus dissolubilis]|uniref:TerC family protein n=1 Tax=Brevibacillus dissolubilis TaxID=1844116 RepID=UPI001115EABF|nr:TerC family protein [Brevibacillus dissolubilis]
MDGGFWIAFFHIFMIDLVLSGDNAVVIGMACRGLPPKEQKKAVLYGTVGAVVLRVLLTTMATWMLDIPLVKAIGGLLLLWIAFKLIIGDEEETNDVAYSKSLGQAVKTIILADFIMSLDNVLAVGGAAHGNLMLVLFGLGFSIPLLMWGSSMVARLINRFPALVYIGSGILSFTALEMCLEDPYVWEIANTYIWNHAWVPLIGACAVVAAGKVFRRT